MALKRIIALLLPTQVKQLLVKIVVKISDKKKARTFYNKNRFTYAPAQDKMRPDTIVGQFTSIASNVWIAPGNHPIDMLTTSPFFYAPYNRGKKEYNERLSEKILSYNQNQKTIIGNDVWIGINSTVLQGIKISDGAVVGANSLVTKDVPPYAIVGGVPAKVLRYRFSEDQIEKLLKLRWWELSMEEINSLPFDDIDECIRKIDAIREVKRNTEILFLVTSVIDYEDKKSLSYSKTRSIYSTEQRNEQTIRTIVSIRKCIPNVKIWLIEGGKKNYDGIVDYGCDRYLYVGNIRDVRAAVDSKFKGVGEAKMLQYVLSESEIRKYKFIVKMSGRYYLDEDFKIDDFDYNRFNFLNYQIGRNRYVGESEYSKGSHSTRLYGVPGNKIDVWRRSLRRCVWEMKFLNCGLESVIAKHIKGKSIFYRDSLHIKGNIAINGEKIAE